jgi:enoyl-CoA hydratase/carnithine racemase
VTQWSGDVTTEDHGANRVIRLSNGEKNLLNPGVMSALMDAFATAKADDAVHGVILTGSGVYFCGGLDVPAIQAGADPVEFATHLVELLKVFPTFPKPIVAVVNGDAVASGSSLAASCDYAVAKEGVKLGTYEVSVGVWPMIAQVPLIKAIGAKAAMENIGSGEPFTTQRAVEVGLLNTVVPGSELLATATSWLTNAHRGQGVYAAGRPTVYEYDQMAIEDALDMALDRFVAQF